MKRSLITLALVAMTADATYAQGTIAFGNSALTRVQVRAEQLGPLRNATAADGLNFYVFFGAAGASADALTQVQQPAPLASIGATDGVMVNAPSVFALPGTEGGQVVSLQIRAWDATRIIEGQTAVVQVTLGPTAGPGAVIWQTATGMNPSRFTPLVVGVIPEPSTIALVLLGLGSLLLFRLRKAKKTLLTLAFVALTTAGVYAQGTIAFGNSALTRVALRNLDGTIRGNATAADGIVFAVFFGPAGSARDALTQVLQPDPKATIGTTAGVMINAPSVFAIPGTEPGQVVSLQIRAWDAATGGQMWYGETDVRQVTLAPTAGPGTVIWQSATGTNPNRFTPMVPVVPEPSTIALAALGLSSWLLLRRRKAHR